MAAWAPDYDSTSTTTWDNTSNSSSANYVHCPSMVADKSTYEMVVVVHEPRHVPKREQHLPAVPLLLGGPGRVPELALVRVRAGKQRMWTGRNYRKVA